VSKSPERFVFCERVRNAHGRALSFRDERHRPYLEKPEADELVLNTLDHGNEWRVRY
jgi:hypothetical protein